MDTTASGPKISIIISALNGSRKLANVIRQAKLVKPGSEIIVVSKGSKDKTSSIAKRAGPAKVIISPPSLGHDAGRSAGAIYASGEILLFIDADFVVSSNLLRQYVSKIEEGWDLALNEYAGASQRDQETLSKHLLNHMLGRPDLTGISMTNVPHALSRRALDRIGIEKLSVPAVAHATAIVNGLSVTPCGYIDISKARRTRHDQSEKLTRRVLEGHAEAISYLTSVHGARAGKTDLGRNREALSLSNHYFEGGG